MMIRNGILNGATLALLLLLQYYNTLIIANTTILLLATEPYRHEGRQVYRTDSSTTTTD